MKKLTCMQKFLSGARFVFAYTEVVQSTLAELQPKEGAEKLPELADVQKEAEEKLAAKQEEVLKGIEISHKAVKGKEDKDLSEMTQTNAKEKAAYAKKQEEFKKNEAARKVALETAKNDFNAAATAAYQALEKAYTDAHEKRKKAAEDFAKSLANELMTARQTERAENAGKDLAAMAGAANLNFQSSVSMPRYGEMKDGSVNPLEGAPTWNGDQVKTATMEMIKAIYLDQGPEAAKAKAAELKEACRAEQADGKVNWFSWHKAFGGDEKGGFGYVLTQMRFDTQRGPELFGKVVGNMNAAKELFKDKADAFSRYEAAVQEAIAKGTDLPTPSDWARENSPELFAQPDKPDAFVDKILESFIVPGIPAFYDTYKKNPKAFSPETPRGKEVAAYEAAVTRKAQARAIMLGALASQPDTSKWDALARQVLDSMSGGKFVAAEMNKIDPDKVMAGRELYGDVGRKLDDESKAYISGLIYGADIAYGGRQVEIEVNGKKEKTDFVKFYKGVLNETLKNNKTDLNASIRDMHESMRDDQDIIRAKNNDFLSPEDRQRTEAKYRSKISELISKNAPTAAEVWEELQESQAESTPAEPAVAATPAPAQRRAPSTDKRAPRTAPATPAAPSSVPQPIAGVPIAANAPAVASQPAPAANPATVPTSTPTETESAPAPVASPAESTSGSQEAVAEAPLNSKAKKFLQTARTFARREAAKSSGNAQKAYESALNIYLNNKQRENLRQLLPEEAAFNDTQKHYRVLLARKEDGSIQASVAPIPPVQETVPEVKGGDTRLASTDLPPPSGI